MSEPVEGYLATGSALYVSREEIHFRIKAQYCVLEVGEARTLWNALGDALSDAGAIKGWCKDADPERLGG